MQDALTFRGKRQHMRVPADLMHTQIGLLARASTRCQGVFLSPRSASTSPSLMSSLPTLMSSLAVSSINPPPALTRCVLTSLRPSTHLPSHQPTCPHSLRPPSTHHLPSQALKPGTTGPPGYRVTFNTSGVCLSGTSAPVFFELVGLNGSSGGWWPTLCSLAPAQA